MQAVILIGGVGSRLRPLTCHEPKPLLPLVNEPFIHYPLKMLRKHGIRDVVLCTSYKAGTFRKVLGNGKALGLNLRFAHEKHPLGTGGALKNGQRLLSNSGPVLVLNGDILHALDVSAFLKFHRRRKADASIALVRVKDPTLYGLVHTDAAGRVVKFVEKPSWDEVETNTINAGAYILEPKVLDFIPPHVPYSLERSLFPLLLQTNRRFFGYVSKGYWMDIGTIDKYLQAHLDILGGHAFGRPAASGHSLALAAGARLGRHLDRNEAALVVGRRAVVEDFARFSGGVCIGEGARVGKGSFLEDCVVLAGAQIKEGVSLKRCVVGQHCVVETQAQISPGAALAAHSRVRAFSRL